MMGAAIVKSSSDRIREATLAKRTPASANSFNIGSDAWVKSDGLHAFNNLSDIGTPHRFHNTFQKNLTPNTRRDF